MNSDVDGATVVIKNSTGFPLYSLTTDQFGYTPEVTLPSNFYLDRNWNNQVGEQGVTVVLDPGPPAITTVMDENTCSDGYDNDGDTLTDDDDLTVLLEEKFHHIALKHTSLVKVFFNLILINRAY